MAKTYRIRFVVEGSGRFPYNMLRYDHCWPEHEHPDSHNIGLEPGDTEYLKSRQVTLLADKENKRWQPTDGRWRSFTWRVISTELVQ